MDSGVENGKSKAGAKPKAGCLTTAWELFVDFTSVTTIHGVRYLGEKNLHFFERIFWIIVMCISSFISFYMIYDLYDKWENNPVIVSFNERTKPTWQIPLPAITICPETKAYKKHVNYTNICNLMMKNASLKGIPEETLKNFEAMTQVCNIDFFVENKFNLPNENFETSEIRDRLMNISLKIDDVFLQCRSINLPIECEILFHPHLMSDGVCFTTNMLNVSRIYTKDALTATGVNVDKIEEEEIDWEMDSGYLTDDAEVHPERIMGSGVASGLVFILKVDKKDIDYVCRGPTQGFKVILHPPNEVPNDQHSFFHISLEDNVLVNVKPKMMETSEGLKRYTPEKRQCFFDHESKLDFFKTYTKTNCEMECAAKYMKAFCGCVHVAMPRLKDTRICGLADANCIQDSKRLHVLMEMGSKVSSLGEDFYENKIDCSCLSSCTSINYEAEVTTSKFAFREIMAALEVPATEYDDEIYSKMTLFFSDNEITSAKRSELYGLSDFIAACGGLLGLFMGISLLSIVEIFYYLSLRPYYNAKSNANKGEDEADVDELQKLNDQKSAGSN